MLKGPPGDVQFGNNIHVPSDGSAGAKWPFDRSGVPYPLPGVVHIPRPGVTYPDRSDIPGPVWSVRKGPT